MTRHTACTTRRALLTGATALGAALAPSIVTAAPSSGGALPPPVVQEVEIAGSYGVPADAAMVAVNVTAVNTGGPGYLAVYACDADRPETSNVNYFADQVVPNLALSALSADGTICIATAALTDVVVDVIGYVPDGSAITPLATPERFLDSREPGGTPSPVPAGSTTPVQITGTAGIPDSATLVMANVTAVGGAAAGYLAAHPCGTSTDGSSVNHLPGEVNANLVVSALDTDGRLCIDNLAPVDVIVDVVAWAGEGVTTLPTPERVLDTRTTGVTPQADDIVRVDLSDDGVPDGATAAIYNLTATNTAGPGYMTSFPCDETRPLASNLNHGTADTTANATITKLTAAGEICIYHLVAADLIVDLIGYTTGTDHYVALRPARALDTRRGWKPECDLMIVYEGPVNQAGRWGALRRNAPDSEVVWLDTPPTANYGPQIAPGCDAGYTIDVNGGVWEVPLDGSDATLRNTLTGDFGVVSVFPLADGRVWATKIVAESSRYQLLDALTGSTVLEFDVSGGNPGFSLTADGGLLGYWSDTFKLVDTATGDVVAERADLPGARVSPDGRYYSYAYVHQQRVYCDVAALDGTVVHSVIYPRIVGEAVRSSDPCEWASRGVLWYRDPSVETVRSAQLFGIESELLVTRDNDRIWSVTDYR